MYAFVRTRNVMPLASLFGRALCVSTLVMTLACPPAATTVTVVPLTGAGDDPWTRVTRVRVRIRTVPEVVIGPIDTSDPARTSVVVGVPAGAGAARVVFEGLSDADIVQATGSTPPIDLNLYLGESIGVLVQRPGTFVATPEPMTFARAHAAAAPVARTWVFIAGGEDAAGPVATTETYDLLSHRFVAGSPNLPAPRSHLGAFAIGEYAVALYGGTNATVSIVFDAPTRSMIERTLPLSAHGDWRDPMTAPLSSGLGLVVGGTTAGTVPRAAAYRIERGGTNNGALIEIGLLSPPRSHGTATLASDGRFVLLYGGVAGGDPAAVIYEETFGTNGTFAVLGGAAPDTRRDHAAAAIGGGRIFIVGGRDGAGTVLDDSLVIDTECVSTGCVPTLSAGPVLNIPRYGLTLSRLDDGRLLAVGGRDAAGMPIGSAEVIDPVALRVEVMVSMRSARAGHLAVELGGGQILVVGGFDAAGVPQSTAEIFTP